MIERLNMGRKNPVYCLNTLKPITELSIENALPAIEPLAANGKSVGYYRLGTRISVNIPTKYRQENHTFKQDKHIRRKQRLVVPAGSSTPLKKIKSNDFCDNDNRPLRTPSEGPLEGPVNELFIEKAISTQKISNLRRQTRLGFLIDDSLVNKERTGPLPKSNGNIPQVNSLVKCRQDFNQRCDVYLDNELCELNYDLFLVHSS